MTNNKLLYFIIVLLLVIIVGGGYFLFVKNNQKPAENALPSTNQESLSEQPNQAKFNEYFSKANLGKLPPGTEFNPFKVVPTQVFSAGDQFCTSLEIRKIIKLGSLSVALYDTVKKEYFSQKSVFPVELKTGGSVGCQNLDYPVGQYEYKIYVDDVLAIVLPFEVK